MSINTTSYSGVPQAARSAIPIKLEEVLTAIPLELQDKPTVADTAHEEHERASRSLNMAVAGLTVMVLITVIALLSINMV